MRDLTPLLSPRSIAVVGASANLDSLAGKPVRHLRDSGLELEVYPVNPNRGEIGGYRAYPDPASLPVAPDAALVVVPAPAVVGAVEALAQRGARSVVVISAGFAETGAQGAADQARLGLIAHAYDMIICGPNTLGIHDYIRGLALSFVWYGRRSAPPDATPGRGTVAVVSQSGSGMTSMCDRLLDAGLPLSFGVATGNEADLTLVEVIEYLAEQEQVQVIATVFEELRDGPRFLATCHRLRALGKPLIAMKVGRTAGGSAVVRSHTGALAGSYPTLRALLRQHGVIEVGDLDDIGPSVAAALTGRFPAGKRFALVTSSGGAAAISADRADEIGLSLPALSTAAQDRIREFMPAFAATTIGNPLDLTAQTMERPHALVDIAEVLLGEPGIDSVIAAVPSGGGSVGRDRGRRLAEVASRSSKPLLSVILSGHEAGEMRGELQRAGVPVFSSPARAVDMLERLSRFTAPPSARLGAPPHQSEAAQWPADDTELSSEYAALRWLARRGIPVIEQRLASTAGQAAAAAEAIGFPVAIKISSPDIVHKTEAGGVALALASAEAVAAGFTQMLATVRASRPGARLDGVTVSPMVTPSLELIAGVHRDPVFGPVVMIGLGGIWAEVLGDVALRGVPVADEEVEQMIDELRGAALLRGARGQVPVTPKALTALVTGLSRIAQECGPRLASLDLNPVAVTADGGLTVLDAAMFIDPAPADAEPVSSAEVLR